MWRRLPLWGGLRLQRRLVTGQLRLRVTAQTCARCARALVLEVGTVPGVAAVDLDAAPGLLTIGWVSPPDAAALRAAISEAGYALR